MKYETPYLLFDGTTLVLTTDRPAPMNFGLLGAKIYTREEYAKHVETILRDRLSRIQ